MIDSSLFTDNANSMNPTCEMVENANNRLIRYCANPTTVPITSDSNEVVNSKFFQIFIECAESPIRPPKTSPNGRLVSDPICSSNKNTKIEIFGITVNHVVTIVGTPSYTSGAQLWNGAAATLNRKPTPMINTPSTRPSSMARPCEIFSCSAAAVDKFTDARL